MFLHHLAQHLPGAFMLDVEQLSSVDLLEPPQEVSCSSVVFTLDGQVVCEELLSDAGEVEVVAVRFGDALRHTKRFGQQRVDIVRKAERAGVVLLLNWSRLRVRSFACKANRCLGDRLVGRGGRRGRLLSTNTLLGQAILEFLVVELLRGLDPLPCVIAVDNTQDHLDARPLGLLKLRGVDVALHDQDREDPPQLVAAILADPYLVNDVVVKCVVVVLEVELSVVALPEVPGERHVATLGDLLVDEDSGPDCLRTITPWQLQGTGDRRRRYD